MNDASCYRLNVPKTRFSVPSESGTGEDQCMEDDQLLGLDRSDVRSMLFEGVHGAAIQWRMSDERA